MNPAVDDYLNRHATWSHVLVPLSRILQEAELEVAIKWGVPVFMLDGRNVVALVAFKAYAGLWFYDGALLSDPDGVLINAQAGKTKALRQWRFKSPAKVDEAAVARYVGEAIENARAGRRIAVTAGRDGPEAVVNLPVRFADALAADAALARAFGQLSAGRRREFANYVGEAKRPETRQRRLEKILPLIMAGEGLSDRYRR